MLLHNLAKTYGGTPWDYLKMTPSQFTVCIASFREGVAAEEQYREEQRRQSKNTARRGW